MKKNSIKICWILVGIVLIGTKKPNVVEFPNFIEEKRIEMFLEQNAPMEKVQTDIETIEPYVAIIEIPKIQLKKGLYEKNSLYNEVNQNIQILKSDYPDVLNGNFILAGHSGIGQAAYFNELNQLIHQDIVYIYYSGIRYQYQVVDFYEIEKTGTAMIRRDPNKTVLTLITCKERNKQLVMICECVSQDFY